MTKTLFLLAIYTAMTGCMQESRSPAPEHDQKASTESLSPEAKSVLDRLNDACSSESWRSDIDMIERPETRPENLIISGEVNGFVSDCKERLAQHGVHVKWNPSKQLYEVEKTQQTDALDKQ